jgi:hypothetical protein
VIRRSLSACAVFWCLGCALADLVPSEGPLRFSGHRLELPGEIELAHFEDLDGDGKMDVVAVYAFEGFDEPARNLALFYQGEAGFSSAPQLTLRLPDEVSQFDFGDVRPEASGKELLFFEREALHWMPLPHAGGGANSPSQVLFAASPIFARAERLELSQRDFARPVREGEADAVFVARSDGYRVYYPDDAYAQPVDYAATHEHRVSEDSYSVTAAQLHFGDFDGDGAKDMAFTHLDEVRVHRLVGNRYAVEPMIDVDMQILSALDREAPEDPANLVGFSIEDFDGDGLCDLFVRKVVVQKKAVVNDKQQYQLFRNRGQRFDAKPDQGFVLKSFDDPELMDLDGDGRQDIVTGYFEFSLTNIVKALLSKRATIDLSFFLYGDGGFPDAPNEARSFKIHISLSNRDENFMPAVELEGDYDGDGRLDFLMQTEDDRIEIFRGVAGGGLFEKKASVKLTAIANDEAFVDDLNGDGKDDIAFYGFPKRAPFDPRSIQILLSH